MPGSLSRSVLPRWPSLSDDAAPPADWGTHGASGASLSFALEHAMRHGRRGRDAPVIVPWRATADDRAGSLLRRIAGMERPLAADLRRLRRHFVSIPRGVRDDWLARGVLRPVHERLGDAMLRLDDLDER